MSTPPAPAPAPKLSDFVKWTDALPFDPKEAKAEGRDPLEVELATRIIEHGQSISSLPDLERFCRERFPEWFLRDVRPAPDTMVPYRPGYRSGQYACRCVWAAFLADLET